MITIEQIKELLEKATKGKLIIAGGNDVDDYPVCNGLPQQWVYSLIDGVTFAYTPKEEVADLLVRIPEIAQLCLDQAAEIERLKTHIFDCSCQFHGEDRNGDCAICHGDNEPCAYCKSHENE